MEIRSRSILLFLFVIILCMSSDAENINNDGNVTYGPLPAGEPYYTISFAFDYGGFPLTWAWAIIDLFLKIISPVAPPYELIQDALRGELDTSTLSSKIPLFLGNFFGFIFFFILGILFCIIFPLILCCFCCCRMAGQCGGKWEQRNSSCFEGKRICLSSCLVITVFFILFGGFTALSVSGYTSRQVNGLPGTIDNSLSDMVTYVNNTLNEVLYIVGDQLDWTIAQLIEDLEGVGEIVGEPVLEDLRPSIDGAIDATIDMDNYLQNTLTAMQDLNATQYDVEVIYDIVDAQLANLTSLLDTKCASCNVVGCCNGFDYSGLELNPDYRDLSISTPTGRFPQAAVDVAIGELESIADRGLAASAIQGRESFESLPETLKNTTAAATGDLEQTFDVLKNSIYGLVNQSAEPLRGVEDVVNEFSTTLDPILDSVSSYNAARDTVMTLVFTFIVLIGFLFFIGVMIGCCGYLCCYETPARRRGCSNCGGWIIFIACVFSGLLIAPFMLISSITFIIGGPIDRLVCDPLISQELFTETIDRPDAIVEGYFLGSTLFNDPTIPMTVSGLLDSCAGNEGIYTAFSLESLFNLSQFTDIDGLVGDLGAFSNITGDFSSIEILSPETADILTDFRDSSADEIDWTLFQIELTKNVTNNTANDPDDLSVLVAAIRTATSSLSDATDISDLNSLADDLETHQTNYFGPLVTKKIILSDQLDTLLNYTDYLDIIVNATIVNAQIAQNVIDTNASSLVQARITDYQERILGYPYQFANYIDDTIRNDVGRCQPVFNIYYAGVNTFCVGFIQAFNGFWYCLGLCTFMFILAFILGIKTSKYYRRMRRGIGFDDHRQPDVALTSHNKIAPHP